MILLNAEFIGQKTWQHHPLQLPKLSWMHLTSPPLSASSDLGCIKSCFQYFSTILYKIVIQFVHPFGFTNSIYLLPNHRKCVDRGAIRTHPPPTS